MSKTVKTMWVWGVSAILMLAMAVPFASAQERMDGISFHTTQIIVRLSGPWATNAAADANVMNLEGGNAPVQINTAGDDGVFDGQTDWRENELPKVVEAGEYLWAHLFLNIVDPQVGQVNRANPNIIIPVLYNLGEGLQYNVLQIANNPTSGQDYIGPRSGSGFNAFPGNVTLSTSSNTELSLSVNRTGPVSNNVYHLTSIKFRIRNILVGGDETRVEVTPAAWVAVGRVDQPDRIADALLKRPAPQYIFEPEVKRHLVDLSVTTSSETMATESFTVTKSAVLSSNFLSNHLGWNAGNDVPVSLYPFPPYMVSYRDPILDGDMNIWVKGGTDETVYMDINGDGNENELVIERSSQYNEGDNTLTLSYSVTGPLALQNELTNAVSGMQVRAIVDFLIRENVFEGGVLRP